MRPCDRPTIRPRYPPSTDHQTDHFTDLATMRASHNPTDHPSDHQTHPWTMILVLSIPETLPISKHGHWIFNKHTVLRKDTCFSHNSNVVVASFLRTLARDRRTSIVFCVCVAPLQYFVILKVFCVWVAQCLFAFEVLQGGLGNVLDFIFIMFGGHLAPS